MLTVQRAVARARVQLPSSSSCSAWPSLPPRLGHAILAVATAFLFLARLEVGNFAAALLTSAAEILRARGSLSVDITMLDMLSLGRPLPLPALSSLMLRLPITMPAPGRATSASVSLARTG